MLADAQESSFVNKILSAETLVARARVAASWTSIMNVSALDSDEYGDLEDRRAIPRFKEESVDRLLKSFQRVDTSE